MWEESCESISVRHRRVSEVREGGTSDSEDEFVVVPEAASEKVPLLPQGPPPSIGDADKLIGATPSTHDAEREAKPSPGATSRAARPESLILNQPLVPLRLVLSSWGVVFSSSDSTPSSEARLHDDEPRMYALLSAENPYFADQACQVAEKLGKSATNQRRAFEMKWDRPDLRILYRFKSVSDYGSMVRDLREGKLRDVKIKGQTYRAVSLEPVRVIDSNLKCFLHMTFPVQINDEIKASLQPLLNSVAVSKRFIFVPSIEHHQKLSAIEETDSAQDQLALPILITLITSQPETSTARQVAEVLKNSQNWSCYVLQCNPNPFKNQELFQHQKHGSFLPLFSLTAGSAGWGMENGIRVTLLCRENFERMVEFYGHLLRCSNPTKTEDYVIFSLMDTPTSIIELVLHKCSAKGISERLLESIVLHFIVEKLTSLAIKLCRKFPNCELTEAGCYGEWKVKDPLGNELVLHDKEWMEACKQHAEY